MLLLHQIFTNAQCIAVQGLESKILISEEIRKIA